MKNDSASFREILREKMGDFPSENAPKSATKSGISGSGAFSVSREEINLSDVAWQQRIDFDTVVFPSKKYARPVSLSVKKVEKSVKSPSTEAVIEVKSLSKTALSALENLKTLGAFELNSQQISLSLVKRSFRRLCLIYHPDQQDLGISSRELAEKSLKFSQLKNAKDELEEFFASYHKDADNKKAA